MSCPTAMEGVGLTATRNTMGMPSVMPPRMPPQWLVLVITRPSRMAKGSLFSLPRRLAASKPAPKAMPLTAGIPNTNREMRLSMPPNRGPPSPAGAPMTAHSITPPTESPSALAARMAFCMASPAALSTTGKGRSAVETVSSPRSAIPAISAMRLMTSTPSRANNCLQRPPTMHSGAVRRPEKWPPPRWSCAPPYFTCAV